MSVLLLLSSYALAGAPVALLLPSDHAVDAKELEAHLQEELELKNLKLQEEPEVEHPKALATALLQRPGECQALLNDKQIEELEGIKDKADDVFLVINTNDKAKGSIVWRYQPLKKLARKIDTKGKNTLPPAEPPGRLILLPYPDSGQDKALIESTATWLGAKEVEVLETDGVLIEALMDKPKACAEELEDAVAARLAEFNKNVEGDVLVAVHAKEGDATHVWRYDPEAKALHSVDVPASR